MAEVDQKALRNRLLHLLSPEAFALLSAHLEPIDLPRGFKLFDAERPARHAYFPEQGMGSLITISPEGHQVEVGLFGHEGFGPTVLVLGSAQSSLEASIQLPGHGHRIAAAPFRQAVGASPELQLLLLRFTQTLGTQAAYSALSNAVHGIEERLARWLLMSHDRVDGNELPLTHEFLSVMLAVRRPSVTTALHVLEGNGFIRAERANITIRNRAAMEAFAGDAYGPPEHEYEQLIGPLR